MRNYTFRVYKADGGRYSDRFGLNTEDRKEAIQIIRDRIGLDDDDKVQLLYSIPMEGNDTIEVCRPQPQQHQGCNCPACRSNRESYERAWGYTNRRAGQTPPDVGEIRYEYMPEPNNVGEVYEQSI